MYQSKYIEYKQLYNITLYHIVKIIQMCYMTKIYYFILTFKNNF